MAGHGVVPLWVLPLTVYSPSENILYKINQNQAAHDFFKVPYHFSKAKAGGGTNTPPRQPLPPGKNIPGEYHRLRHEVPDSWYVVGVRRDSDPNHIDWKFHEPPGPDGISGYHCRSVKKVKEYLENKRKAAEKGEEQETIRAEKRRKVNEVSCGESSFHSGMA